MRDSAWLAQAAEEKIICKDPVSRGMGGALARLVLLHELRSRFQFSLWHLLALCLR